MMLIFPPINLYKYKKWDKLHLTSDLEQSNFYQVVNIRDVNSEGLYSERSYVRSVSLEHGE